MAEYAIFIRSWEGWTNTSPWQEFDLLPPRPGLLDAELDRLANELAAEYPSEVAEMEQYLETQETTGPGGGPVRPPTLIEVVGRVFAWFYNPTRSADLPPLDIDKVEEEEGPPQVFAPQKRYRVTASESWMPGVPPGGSYLATVEDERIAALVVASLSPQAAHGRLGYHRIDDSPAAEYLSVLKSVNANLAGEAADEARRVQQTIEGLVSRPAEHIERLVSELSASRDAGCPARSVVLPTGWHSSEGVNGALARLAREGPLRENDSHLTEGEFIKQGAVWRLRWGKEVTILRHFSGMAYIHLLLCHQGQARTPEQLEAAAAQGAPERMETSGAPSGPSRDPKLDDQALREYRAQAQEYREVLDRTSGTQDPSELAERSEVEDQLQKLEARLHADIGFSGRPRDQGEAEKTRVRVAKAISTARKQVRSVHPALAAHLEASLVKPAGSTPRYEPESPVTWMLW